jgi:hypothetical protein
MAGFVLSYPEMLPFLGLAFLLFHAFAWREVRLYWRQGVVAGALIGLAALALIAPDGLGLLEFLLRQAAAPTQESRFPELMPFFLLPSGIGALWGLTPDAPPLLDTNVAIAIGFVLSGATAIGAAWLAYRREASAALVVVMILLAITLAVNGSGFGLFKLAMYAQPFLMATAILWLCRLFRVAR